jgi:DinB superfamily
MKNSFIALFNRDLSRLFKEIEAYSDDAVLWHKVEGISNPTGNLCLHLIGNLNEYIGRQLGEIPYTRNRPLEFSATDVPKKELLQMIKNTQKVVEKVMKKLKIKQFQDKYPENVLGYDMTVHYFLVHLNGHLNYHLGQINYQRRILAGNK